MGKLCRFVDHTGTRFGKWVVVRYLGNRKWLCRCDCGVEKPVVTPILVNGRSNSCGCRRAEVSAECNRKHGQTVGGKWTKAYRTWASIIQRCTNPHNNSFKYYGGRGITVCERWREFDAFFEDMGEPASRMTIDRINTNGDYEPGNCRWATYKQQNNNRRSNRAFTLDGLTMTISQWADFVGMDQKRLNSRIKTGWKFEDAISTPYVHQRDRRARAKRLCAISATSLGRNEEEGANGR